MPFRKLEREDVEDVQAALVRAAQEFARLVEAIPSTVDAPEHPEVGEVARSFERINQILTRANQAGVVTAREKLEIAAEFESMGAALRGRGETGQRGKQSR